MTVTYSIRYLRSQSSGYDVVLAAAIGSAMGHGGSLDCVLCLLRLSREDGG